MLAAMSASPKFSSRAAVVVAALGLLVGGAGVATAATRTAPSAPSSSRPASQPGLTRSHDRPYDIPNLDKVKDAIRVYYGDTGDDQAAATSRYGRQVRGVERRAGTELPRLIKRAIRTPVLLLDVDDTTLLTYNYEATHDFGYDPVANAVYIHEHGMGPVFGMPALVRRAHAEGAQIFYLTGRPSTQRADTLRDLAKAGYPQVRSSRLFMRDKTSPPPYLPCEPDCTTVQYKSLTRRHIQSLGYRIVLDLGDQRSDLAGGYRQAALKLPNPMYFIP